MHDIDRTIDELEYEGEGGFGELEFEDEGDFESSFESEPFEELEAESPFGESEEMELASELLTVSDDEELEQFLGKLFKKAWGGIKKAVKSPVFRKLGGIVKGLAKKALPIAGTALGTFFGGPAGGAIGGKLGGFASKLFELELEGLSPEDQEFEVARRIVRFAGTAARKAAKAPFNASPNAVVKAAIKSAARMHAPGLLKGPALHRCAGSGYRYSGRWIRKGRKIVLLGI